MSEISLVSIPFLSPSISATTVAAVAIILKLLPSEVAEALSSPAKILTSMFVGGLIGMGVFYQDPMAFKDYIEAFLTGLVSGLAASGTYAAAGNIASKVSTSVTVLPEEKEIQELNT